MEKEKKTHGGKRTGSGRRKRPPTKTVSFRVRLELVDSVKVLVREYLNSQIIVNQ
jgi:hypothetical protein